MGMKFLVLSSAVKEKKDKQRSIDKNIDLIVFFRLVIV